MVHFTFTIIDLTVFRLNIFKFQYFFKFLAVERSQYIDLTLYVLMLVTITENSVGNIRNIIKKRQQLNFTVK